jgi:hypothetical protein
MNFSFSNGMGYSTAEKNRKGIFRKPNCSFGTRKYCQKPAAGESLQVNNEVVFLGTNFPDKDPKVFILFVRLIPYVEAMNKGMSMKKAFIP